MNNNFTDGTYTDAISILDKLEQRAKLMANEKDDACPPSYGTSNENDERYKDLHQLVVKFAGLNMTRERFYAACDLVEDATRTVYSASGRWPQQDSPLAYHIYSGTEQILIFIEHNRYNPAIQRLQLDRLAKNLPAPVTAFPFSSVKQAMIDSLTLTFTGWQLLDTNRAQKTFDNRNKFLLCHSAMCDLEKLVKEHDVTFTLNIKLDDHRKQSFSVDKASLDIAQGIIGYVGQEPRKESIVQMMVANSPIMSSKRVTDCGNNDVDQPVKRF